MIPVPAAAAKNTKSAVAEINNVVLTENKIYLFTDKKNCPMIRTDKTDNTLKRRVGCEM